MVDTADYLIEKHGIINLPDEIDHPAYERILHRILQGRELHGDKPLMLYCRCSGGLAWVAGAYVLLILGGGAWVESMRLILTVLPLANVDYTGDIELDAHNALDALKAHFKERDQKTRESFHLLTDSEFWFAICFESREQKEEFMSKLGILAIGDKCLDGLKVAAALGIELTSPELPKRSRIDKRLAALVHDEEDILDNE